MRVAGFTFIRNALQYDYPVVEAITSILPICDYFLVAVGRSDDNTLELVRGIKRVKIKSPRLPAVSNEELVAELREAGQQLARIRQGETVGRAAHELLNEL